MASRVKEAPVIVELMIFVGVRMPRFALQLENSFFFLLRTRVILRFNGRICRTRVCRRIWQKNIL